MAISTVLDNGAAPGFTVRLNDADPCCPPASVNVTVYVVLANPAFGAVPEIVTSTELYNLTILSEPVTCLTIRAVLAVSPVGKLGDMLILRPETVPVVVNDVATAEPP